MRVGAVQGAPQRDLSRAGPAGEEHRLGVAGGDLFDLAREVRGFVDDDAVVRGDFDPGLFGFLADDRGKRHLEGILVVEHVDAVDAQRAHQARLRGGLDGVAGLQASEVAFAARVEAFRLVLAGVQRGGQPDIRAGRADLQDPRLVDDRQRHGRRRRAVVPQVGDRGCVLGGLLGRCRDFPGGRLAAGRVGVVEREVGDSQRADMAAGVSEGQLLACFDLLGDRGVGTLQRQARVDGQLVAGRFRGRHHRPAAGERWEY